jgi:hypothetical protein
MWHLPLYSVVIGHTNMTIPQLGRLFYQGTVGQNAHKILLELHHFIEVQRYIQTIKERKIISVLDLKTSLCLSLTHCTSMWPHEWNFLETWANDLENGGLGLHVRGGCCRPSLTFWNETPISGPCVIYPIIFRQKWLYFMWIFSLFQLG